MVIEVLVLERNEALLDFLGRCGTRWESPLSVGGDASTEQLIVPVGHHGGVGHVKQLPGKTENISYHQKSKDT